MVVLTAGRVVADGTAEGVYADGDDEPRRSGLVFKSIPTQTRGASFPKIAYTYVPMTAFDGC